MSDIDLNIENRNTQNILSAPLGEKTNILGERSPNKLGKEGNLLGKGKVEGKSMYSLSSDIILTFAKAKEINQDHHDKT